MKRTKRNKGAALVLAVLSMVMLLITGGGLLSLGFHGRSYQSRTASDIAARCAADAAMNKAIYEINSLFTSGNLGNELPIEANVSLTGSDSDYSYSIVKNGSTYTITATGQSNGVQRTVGATLVATNPFDFAIFSDEEMIMRNSAEIDWYNNDASDSPLKVGTNSIDNGAVELKNSIKINGDVVVGVGGNPDDVISMGNSSEVSGDTYSQSTNKILPEVTVPAYLQSAASKGTLKKSKTITTSEKYDSINLGNSKEIKISGNVELYVTGDIDLGNSAKIELDDSNPNSSLKIYLDGKLVSKNSSELNNKTENPKNFKLYGTDSCTSLDFRNSAKMYGVIYAPKADIVFHNSIDLYGALAGKSMDLKNSAKIMYDASLRDPAGDDNLVSLKINRWSE